MFFLFAVAISLVFSADLTAQENRDECFGGYKIYEAKGKLLAGEKGRCGPADYFTLEPRMRYVFSGDVPAALFKAGLAQNMPETFMAFATLQFKDSADAAKVQVLLDGRAMKPSGIVSRTDFSHLPFGLVAEILFSLPMREDEQFRVEVIAASETELKIIDFDMKPQ